MGTLHITNQSFQYWRTSQCAQSGLLLHEATKHVQCVLNYFYLSFYWLIKHVIKTDPSLILCRKGKKKKKTASPVWSKQAKCWTFLSCYSFMTKTWSALLDHVYSACLTRTNDGCLSTYMLTAVSHPQPGNDCVINPEPFFKLLTAEGENGTKTVSAHLSPKHCWGWFDPGLLSVIVKGRTRMVRSHIHTQMRKIIRFQAECTIPPQRSRVHHESTIRHAISEIPNSNKCTRFKSKCACFYSKLCDKNKKEIKLTKYCVKFCVIWKVGGDIHSHRSDRMGWPLPVIDMLILCIHSTSLSLFPPIKANASETVIKPCPGKRLPAAFNEAPLILPLFAIGLPITSTAWEQMEVKSVVLHIQVAHCTGLLIKKTKQERLHQAHTILRWVCCLYVSLHHSRSCLGAWVRL